MFVTIVYLNSTMNFYNENLDYLLENDHKPYIMTQVGVCRVLRVV